MNASVLGRWDKRYLWHPFTQHSEWLDSDPIVITSAKGVYLKDATGRWLMDGNSSLWVNVWGHCVPELDRALKRQIGKVSHSTFLGLTHEPAIRLAKELLMIAPKGLSRVFYSDNGSTAVEVAVKMAYQYWQMKGERRKTKYVSMKDGYHGDTLGSVSVGGIALFHSRFQNLLFKGWIVDPSSRHPREGGGPAALKSLDSRLRGNDGIERILKLHHESIAAVVMEPLVQGASGMRLMPKGYLAHVAKLCKKYQVLLIIDEVATGFGRTGTMFACEQEGVTPDFLCVAKSITGGYLPLAATLTKEFVFKAFTGDYEKMKTFFHGHTYTANPLACAVALENLALYKKKRLLTNVQARSRQLADGLKPLAEVPGVRDIRQVGLMVGLELQDRATVLRACREAIRRGLWLRPLGKVLVLMPPLAISEKELAFLIDVTRNSVILATGCCAGSKSSG